MTYDEILADIFAENNLPTSEEDVNWQLTFSAVYREYRWYVVATIVDGDKSYSAEIQSL
jgi:hypothetical protein